MKKPELLPLPDIKSLKKLVDEIDRCLFEADRHRKLAEDSRQEEARLLTTIDIADAGQFKELADRRLFTELAERKIPEFEARAEQLTDEIKAIAMPVKSAHDAFCTRCLDIRDSQVDALLAPLISNNVFRQKLVAESRSKTDLYVQLIGISNTANYVPLWERPLEGAKGLLKARAKLAELLPALENTLLAKS